MDGVQSCLHVVVDPVDVASFDGSEMNNWVEIEAEVKDGVPIQPSR